MQQLNTQVHNNTLAHDTIHDNLTSFYINQLASVEKTAQNIYCKAFS